MFGSESMGMSRPFIRSQTFSELKEEVHWHVMGMSTWPWPERQDYRRFLIGRWGREGAVFVCVRAYVSKRYYFG